MSKYSDIMSYLEDVDDDIAQVYKDCCIESLFNPRGKPGVTFLLPDKKTNKKLREDLIEKAAGDTESKLELSQRLAALVIFDNIPSIDVFKSKSDHIPNGLNQLIPIDLTGCTSNSIKFKSGATAVLDSNFQCTKKNFNVYILHNGEIGINGTSITRSGEIANNRRRKVEEPVVKPPSMWSAEDPDESMLLRNRIAKETENAYIAAQIQRDNRRSASGPRRNIYAEQVLSLIGFIMTHCSDVAIKEILVGRVLPQLSYEHIDFYLFVQPNISTDSYLIPTDIIKRWYSSEERFNPERTIASIDNLYKNSGDKSAIMSKRLQLQEVIDNIRTQLSSSSKDQRTLPESIGKIYADIINTNKMTCTDTIDNVFGTELYNLYKLQPMMKIGVDEIRYLSHRLFESLESDVFDRDQYAAILENIRRYLIDPVTPKTLRLLNVSTIKHAIGPQEKINEIKSFINSKYFLYSPMTLSETEAFQKDYETSTSPCVDGEGIWFPFDIRKQVIASYKARVQTSESSGFISESERALNILKNAKASGQKFDPTQLSFLTEQ